MKQKVFVLKNKIKEKGYWEQRNRVLLKVHSSQLWYMMMAFQDNPHLMEQKNKLSKELYKIGKKEFNWA